MRDVGCVQVEQEIAQTVGDEAAVVEFYPLQDVRVRAKNERRDVTDETG